MTEARMRRRVVAALKPLHAFAVENRVHPGTPDVNYVEGWLELKQVDSWPARESTVLAVPHFTQQQRLWLALRCERGGQAHVLLQVRQEYLLLHGLEAARLLGRATRAELSEVAVRIWHGRQMEEEIAACLSRQVN